MGQRTQFVGLCGLFVMYYHFYHTQDKRLVKALLDVHRKVSTVVSLAFLLIHTLTFFYLL